MRHSTSPYEILCASFQEEHLDFVYATSILHAQQYRLEPILDRKRVAQLATAHKPVPFVPRDNVRIAVTDAEAEAQKNGGGGGADEDDSEAVVDALNLQLARINLSEIPQLMSIDFEKDDDTNHHVEFVTAASNLRANNYAIQPADRMKVRRGFFSLDNAPISFSRRSKLPAKSFRRSRPRQRWWPDSCALSYTRPLSTWTAVAPLRFHWSVSATPSSILRCPFSRSASQ